MSSRNLLEQLEFLNIIRLYVERRKLIKKRQRRWRFNPINKEWAKHGYFSKTFNKIKELDEEHFFTHTRMTRSMYASLFNLMAPSLTKPKQTIHAEERLSLTLLHLAHGQSIQSLAWSHKLGKTTVRNIVLETCEAIWQQLSPTYVSEPSQHHYINIASDFQNLWNMPNCVGAIDGKHIAMKCPANSGSLFHNYKKFFSIVLMAACDAKYCFTAVAVGAYGSQSDGGIFRTSQFGQDLLQNKLPLPPDTALPSTQQLFPHFFVGDCAFPLKDNLMKPFPNTESVSECHKRIFNYRLSRARRVIENSFGILTARWRVLRTTLQLSPTNAEKIVLACVALHNFCMRQDADRVYCPQNYTEEDDASINWRSDLRSAGGPLRSLTTSMRRGLDSAYRYRNVLADYFMNEGAVDFQYVHVDQYNNI